MALILQCPKCGRTDTLTQIPNCNKLLNPNEPNLWQCGNCQKVSADTEFQQQDPEQQQE